MPRKRRQKVQISRTPACCQEGTEFFNRETSELRETSASRFAPRRLSGLHYLARRRHVWLESHALLPKLLSGGSRLKV